MGLQLAGKGQLQLCATCPTRRAANIQVIASFVGTPTSLAGEYTEQFGPGGSRFTPVRILAIARAEPQDDGVERALSPGYNYCGATVSVYGPVSPAKFSTLT